MGNSCMQKSRDMVLTMMSAAHVNTARILSYYKAKKEGYDYKGASINDNDFDYERDILLDEDADDFNAFDYEEQSDLIVINAPAPQYKSRQEMIQEQKEKNTKNKQSNNSNKKTQINTSSSSSSSSSNTKTSSKDKKEKKSEQFNSSQNSVLLDFGNTKDDNNSLDLKIGWQQDSNNTKTSNHSSNNSQLESQPLKNSVDPQEEYDSINDVMNEIQQNLTNNGRTNTLEEDDEEERLDNNNYDDYESNLLQYAYNPNTKQQDSANFADDHDADALMQDIDNMIKYEEDDDDDEEAGILDRV